MAIVVVSTRVGIDVKFVVAKESRFLRDLYPDVKDFEKYYGNDPAYFGDMCRELSYRYGMRIQYDTPVQHDGYQRTRFRYLASDWKYGVIKGNASPIDTCPRDTALRELREELLGDVELDIQDMGIVICRRRLFTLHLEDYSMLYSALSDRNNSYFGELFEPELKSWDELRDIWPHLNVVSKRALEYTMY